MNQAGTWTRNFTGCLTCRRRHVRCDETRPHCLACQRQRLECPGYAPQLHWVNSDRGSSKGKPERQQSSYRAPLFTLDVRRSMSQNLVESLGMQLACDAAIELDDLPLPDDELHSIGPFGVFRGFDIDDLSSLPSSPLVDLALPVDFPVFDSGKDTEDHPPHVWQEASNLQTLNPDCVPVAFWPELAMSDDWMSFQPRLIDNPGHSGLHEESPTLDFACFRTLPGLTIPIDATVHPFVQVTGEEGSPPSPRQSRLFSTLSPDRSPSRMSGPSFDIFGTDTLPCFAIPLLRYFRSEVLGGSLHSKITRVSPWKQLVLPYALETFAELSIWAKTTHARQSIMSTLLAKSAWHLHQAETHTSESSAHWLRVARVHDKSALKHLNTCLQSELIGQSQAPYAEILMAILSLAVVTVYFHGTRFVKELLLHAERLIRLRGLGAELSFSARMLHHMYAHLRVLVESTDIPKKSPNPTQAHPEFELLQPGDDTAIALQRFRVNRSSLGDLDILRAKPHDIGYTDIHLDATGVWIPTLFPDMYGIPESLMTLVSQTVSLANEKPRLERAATKDPAVAQALARHIKALEACIWSLASDLSSDSAAGPDAAVPDHDHPTHQSGSGGGHWPNKPLSLAMHHALVIYFYRRIHNLDARILQSHVKQALDHLGLCIGVPADPSCSTTTATATGTATAPPTSTSIASPMYEQDYAASAAWACFVAAAEAVEPEMQRRSLACLRALGEGGGDGTGGVGGGGLFLGVPGGPVRVVREVWDRRTRDRRTRERDWTVSWVDVL